MENHNNKSNKKTLGKRLCEKFLPVKQSTENKGGLQKENIRLCSS